MTALRVLLFAVLLAGLATPAAAQEGTTDPNGDDPLTRYDSPSTAELAAQYGENEKRAQEIEVRIEELEEDFDFGAERDRLRDELYAMQDATEAANRLGDARLSDTESAPLPPGSAEKAEELRRKAASLDALQAWSNDAPIDVNSRLYGLLSEGEAASLADAYRREAGALEVAAGTEDAAEEEKRAAEGAVPGPKPDNEEGAAGVARGAEPRVGGGGVDRADDAPPVPPETGYGEGGNLNIGTLLVLSVMALGAGAYGLSLLSRRPWGRKVSGAWKSNFGGMMASSGGPSRQPPREEPRPPGQVTGEATERPGTVTKPREESRGGEGGGEPGGASHGPVTPPARSSTVTETGSPDAEALAEWFSKEAPEEDPETPMEDLREAPAPRQDVNQMVAEEVARMRESGELGPDDEVVVTVVDGKLVVRKKG